MFALQKIQELFEQKHWYNLCLYIQQYVESNTKECIDAYLTFVIPNETIIHYNTFCQTTLILANLLQAKESLFVLNEALTAINKNDYIHDEKQLSIMKFNIKVNENKIYLNELNGIELFIYEVKNLTMDQETKNMYYKLCYKYYECKNDYDKAYSYIIKYLEGYDDSPIDKDGKDIKFDEEVKHKRYNIVNEDNNEVLAYKIVKFALLSTNIYNFTGIYFHKMYKYLKDQEIRLIFENVTNGSVKFVLEHENEISNKLPGNYELLREKTYLIELIKMCFYKKEKQLLIGEIMNHLNLERGFVFYILMKALGLGLIKGTIDGENDFVKLNYVMPRILNKEEVVEIKEKYVIWQSKIREVIQMFE